MIDKAESCKGGGRLFGYVIDDKKGYELMRNNLAGISPKEISYNMSIIQQQNQRCSNKIVSMVLSPSVEDGRNLSKDKLEEITTDFLSKMELDPTNKQFIAFVHTEKKHNHIHILMNRVNFDGSLIKDSNIGLNAQRNAHETALKHGLISAWKVKEANEREREKSNLEIKK